MYIPYSRKFSRGVQFSQMGDLVTFRGSILTDAHDRAITSMYKYAYFVGLIFVVHESSVKTTKIGPLISFPLYGSARNLVCAL